MGRAANWFRHPQGVWVRKALFQVHLWTGLGVGLYIVVISVTGSVLVYRSELRQLIDVHVARGHHAPGRGYADLRFQEILVGETDRAQHRATRCLG